MESKPAYLSKTIWMNLILALAAFYPPVGDYLKGHEEYVLMAFSVLNIGLRLISKDKISIG